MALVMTTVFRAVSQLEYSSIIATGQFSLLPGGNEMKQFGFNLTETLNFATFQPDYAFVIRAEIPDSALARFHVSKIIDPFIFRSGVLTVIRQPGLVLFNSLVTNITRAY